jgi:hypothetical protein
LSATERSVFAAGAFSRATRGQDPKLKKLEPYFRGKSAVITGGSSGIGFALADAMADRRRQWTKAGVDARFHDTRHTTGMRTLRTTGNLNLVRRSYSGTQRSPRRLIFIQTPW